jgi:hypothetical protein
LPTLATHTTLATRTAPTLQRRDPRAPPPPPAPPRRPRRQARTHFKFLLFSEPGLRGDVLQVGRRPSTLPLRLPSGSPPAPLHCPSTAPPLPLQCPCSALVPFLHTLTDRSCTAGVRRAARQLVKRAEEGAAQVGLHSPPPRAC